MPAVVAEAGVDAGDGGRHRRSTSPPARCCRSTARARRCASYEHWRGRPHAWPKLWKHHAAQPVADRLNEVALERGEEFLSRYGGRISSEWYFPKLIELWLEDREVYDEAYAFIEATDWIVWWLTGLERRQSCTAGYKAMWSPDEGLPSSEYFEAAYPASTRPGEKLGARFVAARHARRDAAARGRAGDRAARVGRGRGRQRRLVRVGAGRGRRAAGHVRDGRRHLDLRHGRRPRRDPAARDHRRRAATGSCPGCTATRPGRWRSATCSPGSSSTLAPERRRTRSSSRRPARIGPGETGLVALDWWNGNRTILADADLTGVIVGLTLQSTPERDLPGAARVDRVRQPADHGELRGARPRARRRSSPAAGSPSAAR